MVLITLNLYALLDGAIDNIMYHVHFTNQTKRIKYENSNGIV